MIAVGKYKSKETESFLGKMNKEDGNREMAGSKSDAEEINKFFLEVGPKLEKTIRWPEESMGRVRKEEFKLTRISESEMEKILGKIKPKTLAGPDEIST